MPHRHTYKLIILILKTIWGIFDICGHFGKSWIHLWKCPPLFQIPTYYSTMGMNRWSTCTQGRGPARCTTTSPSTSRLWSRTVCCCTARGFRETCWPWSWREAVSTCTSASVQHGSLCLSNWEMFSSVLGRLCGQEMKEREKNSQTRRIWSAPHFLSP